MPLNNPPPLSYSSQRFQTTLDIPEQPSAISKGALLSPPPAPEDLFKAPLSDSPRAVRRVPSLRFVHLVQGVTPLVVDLLEPTQAPRRPSRTRTGPSERHTTGIRLPGGHEPGPPDSASWKWRTKSRQNAQLVATSKDTGRLLAARQLNIRSRTCCPLVSKEQLNIARLQANTADVDIRKRTARASQAVSTNSGPSASFGCLARLGPPWAGIRSRASRAS